MRISDWSSDVCSSDLVFLRLAEDFTPRFAAHGLSFRVVATRATVRADSHYLQRLLALLLDNAAKFTSSGGVRLGCRRAGGRLRSEERRVGKACVSTCGLREAPNH